MKMYSQCEYIRDGKIPTTTGAAVSEGTHCTPNPVIRAAHSALWLMDALIATHAMTYPTSIVTPHHALATSPADLTCTIIL